MQRTQFAALLAAALSAVPDPVMQAMRQMHTASSWRPTQHRHRSHGGGHAGESANSKARNRKRNKIARASRRANRA